ncbi:MAG: SUMF1/EgtB/PvdO family nonheme iron enzyme [Candidatus Delongbacteria bacterium]|nr:SUMF1/EgtB/PvdO family nonheme iron enzyme [Candidatus Delongbacteria bacterium]MBN2836721.1 SUMF1/EgtB/PvdO family nonheme iron enzyme [Candidatus Delongbacteria bacterium]
MRLIVLIIFFYYVILSSKTVYGEAEYSYSDNESYLHAKEICKNIAIKNAMESFAVFIKSESKVENYSLTEEYIISQSMGFLTGLEFIGKIEDKGNSYISYKIKAEIDEQKVMEALNLKFKSDEVQSENVKNETTKIFNDSENLVLVEGGSFIMGSDFGRADELPTREIELNSFYISKHEVTQKLWTDVMKYNPSAFLGQNERDLNRPVDNVSWFEAIQFCNKLSILQGLEECYSGLEGDVKCDFNKNGYRLPTEAEWEFACIGGNKTNKYKYSGSNDVNDVAVYLLDDKCTLPVASKNHNEIGCYDMSGNVWEWCNDWYGKYDISERFCPDGPSSGLYKVLRGGSSQSNSAYQTCTIRMSDLPKSNYSRYGFRLVKKAD